MSWKNIIKRGAFLYFLNRKNNAPHHSTILGKWIQHGQSYTKGHDSTVTHVGLVKGINKGVPKQAYTEVCIRDNLDGLTVGDRIVERNYAIEIYQLKDGLILNDNPRITSEDLMNKALEVTEQFEGMPYDRSTLAKIIFFPSQHLYKNERYTKWLCERFKVNTQHGTFSPDIKNDTVICSEFAIVSYQIAWLLLAGKGAENKRMPDFLNIHAHSSAAGLIKFQRENECYEPVDPIYTHALRYSGTPHPNDPPTPPHPEPLGYKLVRLSVPIKPTQHPLSQKIQAKL